MARPCCLNAFNRSIAAIVQSLFAERYAGVLRAHSSAHGGVMTVPVYAHRGPLLRAAPYGCWAAIPPSACSSQAAGQRLTLIGVRMQLLLTLFRSDPPGFVGLRFWQQVARNRGWIASRLYPATSPRRQHARRQGFPRCARHGSGLDHCAWVPREAPKGTSTWHIFTNSVSTTSADKSCAISGISRPISPVTTGRRGLVGA